MLEAKATTIIAKKLRFSRCFRCSAKIYIKEMYICNGYRTKLTAFNFHNNRRHYCYLDPVPYEKVQLPETTTS